MAEALPVDQLDALTSKPGILVPEYPSFSTTYLYLNNKKAPLNNPDVRRAISYAVDYSGIIGGVLKGQATQMRGPIPAGMWGHRPLRHDVQDGPGEGQGPAGQGGRRQPQAELPATPRPAPPTGSPSVSPPRPTWPSWASP